MYFLEHPGEFTFCLPGKDALLIFKAYFSNGLGILRPTAGLHQSEKFYVVRTGTTHLAILV
jgi:hypothetical protein